jgi:hypothetical protein
VEFCGGHVIEAEVNEAARGKDWPTPSQINYDTLGDHVHSLKNDIATTVQGPQINMLFQRIVSQFQREGALQARSLSGLH